jgi:hypothetical protein
LCLLDLDGIDGLALADRSHPDIVH